MKQLLNLTAPVQGGVGGTDSFKVFVGLQTLKLMVVHYAFCFLLLIYVFMDLIARLTSVKELSNSLGKGLPLLSLILQRPAQEASEPKTFTTSKWESA